MLFQGDVCYAKNPLFSSWFTDLHFHRRAGRLLVIWNLTYLLSFCPIESISSHGRKLCTR